MESWNRPGFRPPIPRAEKSKGNPMNKFIRCLTIAGAAAFLTASAARAQIMIDNYYVKAGLGPSFTQTIHYKNSPNVINVDPGLRVDLIFGGEFEIGSLYNTLDTGPGQTIGNNAIDAQLYQLPFVANLIFKLPLRGGVTPYIGGGAGGVASSLYLHTSTHYWAYDTDVTFAYQGMAGIDFNINKKMTVGVGYKFMGSLDHSWFGDNPLLTTRTEDIFNHSVLATFVFKF
jgi:opacity protein-like surface antigen